MITGQLQELILKNRSYRRFDESKKVTCEMLEKYVDSARISQSAANLQPLSYVIITDEKAVEEMHGYVRWAGYLADWKGAEKGERPTAYMAVLSDTEKNKFAQVDSGLAMQNICLLAVSEGVGTCMIGNMDKEGISNLIELDETRELVYVVAFGYPVEDVRLVDFKGDVKYYRDEKMVHYVPKRILDEVLIKKI